jgi:hypothetical protein
MFNSAERELLRLALDPGEGPGRKSQCETLAEVIVAKVEDRQIFRLRTYAPVFRKILKFPTPSWNALLALFKRRRSKSIPGVSISSA